MGVRELFGLRGGSVVPLFSPLGVAGILESFGGLAILLGLFTQLAAFLLAGKMAVATSCGRYLKEREPLSLDLRGV